MGQNMFLKYCKNVIGAQNTYVFSVALLMHLTGGLMPLKTIQLAQILTKVLLALLRILKH